MIIRNGFVTNSSSTNYIIMSLEELTPETLSQKLGIRKNSPLYKEVYDLCEELLDKRGGFRHSEGKTLEEAIVSFFGDETLKMYKKYKNKDGFIYYGHLRDDDGDGTLVNAVVVDCYRRKEKTLYIDFSDWMI